MEEKRTLERQKGCPEGLTTNIYKNQHLSCDHVYPIYMIMDVKQNFQLLSKALFSKTEHSEMT